LETIFGQIPQKSKQQQQHNNNKRSVEKAKARCSWPTTTTRNSSIGINVIGKTLIPHPIESFLVNINNTKQQQQQVTASPSYPNKMFISGLLSLSLSLCLCDQTTNQQHPRSVIPIHFRSRRAARNVFTNEAHLMSF